MRQAFSRIHLIAVFAGIIALIIFFWPTDEKRIMKQFDALLAEASKTGDESLVAQGMKKVRLGESLGTNLLLELGHPFAETMNREEFMRMIQYVRYQTTFLDIKKRGANLFKVGSNKFEMETTVEADVRTAGQAERFLGSYRLVWEKQENQWVISGGIQLDVIEHPRAP